MLFAISKLTNHNSLAEKCMCRKVNPRAYMANEILAKYYDPILIVNTKICTQNRYSNIECIAHC